MFFVNVSQVVRKVIYLVFYTFYYQLNYDLLPRRQRFVCVNNLGVNYNNLI